MLTLHEDKSTISKKQASEKRGSETREGGWFLRAALLNRPQPHKQGFSLSGHLQTACADLLNLEIGHERGWGNAIYQWFFPSHSHVSLLKSNPPVWTLPNFQVVRPDQRAASGETRVFAAQSGQGVCPGAPPQTLLTELFRLRECQCPQFDNRWNGMVLWESCSGWATRPKAEAWETEDEKFWEVP